MTRHTVTIVCALLMTLVIADAAQAVYHPTLGRFAQRDPNGTALSPEAGAGAASVANPGFAKRDPGQTAHSTFADPTGQPSSQYTNGMSLYQYVQNNPTGFVDPSGEVAQWVAGCGIGGCVGGIGGFFGGLADGFSLRNAGCGALGGAISGCCSGVICTSMPAYCTYGSCLCGAIGSLADQICRGGMDYSHPCAWMGLSFGGVVGCIGGGAGQAEDAKLKVISFITGYDIAVLNSMCN